MSKALVAMSGGVDSSVALYLTLKSGAEAEGVTMRLFDKEGAAVANPQKCGGADDAADARRVCEMLGAKHEVIDYEADFKHCVIDYFVDSYMAGATPIPCIECNRNLKFGALFDEALKRGCDTVVTGHYARVIYEPSIDRYLLMRAKEPAKDQTYVLYFLGQDKLKKLRFPCGEYGKDEIRFMASAAGLPVASKKDSEDICFVPDGNYAGIIERELEASGDALPGQGNYVDSGGNVLGTHEGYYRYTVGQRKGLGIAIGSRVFVTGINPEKNEVILGTDNELYRRNVHAVRCNFTTDILPDGTRIHKGEQIRCSGKIRYGLKEAEGTLTINDDGSIDMLFDDAVRAPVRGQSLVLYVGDCCIGGGIID